MTLTFPGSWSPRVVEKLGFVPIKAEDGAEALKLADHFDPDAFILDVDMPKLDGLQVLAALREEVLLR